MDKEFQMLGLMTIGDKEYVVLSEKGSQIEPPHCTYLKPLIEFPKFLVARVFFIEKNEEGVLTGNYQYVNPHWITVSGTFSIEWLAVPQTVTVEVTQ